MTPLLTSRLAAAESASYIEIAWKLSHHAQGCHQDADQQPVATGCIAG